MTKIIVLGPFLSIFIGDCKSTLHVLFLQSKASPVLLQVDGFKSLPGHCKASLLICPGDPLSSSDILVLTSLYRLILFLFNAHLFGNSLSKSFEIMLLVTEWVSLPWQLSLIAVDGSSQYNTGDRESKVQKIVYFVRQIVEDFFWLFLCVYSCSLHYL